MAISSTGYELIDFGDGRKLERFGDIVVDRPCPAAECEPSEPESWASAGLIYHSSRLNSGSPTAWSFRENQVEQGSCIDSWDCAIGVLVFRLRPQSSGQIGLFPEHWNTWPWIAERLSAWQVAQASGGGTTTVPRVLHLFAYTGATTLALAKMGAHVTHVDAMGSAVQWGRENAKLSGLESRPVRWIVEDARKYVSREIRRGQTYDLVVLDPPSYGHGTKGQAWEIHRDLVPLVEGCWQLLSEAAIGMVLTGHSPDVSFKELKMVLDEVDGGAGAVQYQTQQAGLLDRSGRMLDCGYVAKFVRAGSRMRLE
jgi:23S rRNA (cytosine1962-C5)-methyltransferase